jgi:hypothetical protein
MGGSLAPLAPEHTDREYVLVGSVANQPAALPPFTDLQIDPAALWS